MSSTILKNLGAGFLLVSFCNLLHANLITASDASGWSGFGYSVAQNGNYALVGANMKDDKGAVYLYDLADNYKEIKITASDGKYSDAFGTSVSINGNLVFVGASIRGTNVGAVYIYDLNSSLPNYGQIILTASVSSKEQFGHSVSQSGNYALVGAWARNTNTGAAYVYNLSNSANNYGEIRLTASDGRSYDGFGYSVSQSGNYALVGTNGADAAYVYNVSNSANNYGEIKLTATGLGSGNNFGKSVSQSGSYALVGASGKPTNAGAAYVYDVSNSANNYGEIKLSASDAVNGNQFGWSVSQSGNYALVGARGKSSDTGAAYLYDISNPDNNYGEIKITASDAANPASGGYFGHSVSIDGDNFIVGAYGLLNRPGLVYSGTVSSISTLDDGTSKIISGISFKSKRDWIIGKTVSGNIVTLSAGDTADVTEAGKAVYIGKESGSNNNALIIRGTLKANEVVVGAVGNSGNQLYIADTGDISDVADVYLHKGSGIFFEDENNFFDAFGDTILHMLDENNAWTVVSSANYDDLIGRGILSVTVDAMGMMVGYGIVPIPEPAEIATLLGLLALGFAAYRKRK